MKKYLIYTVNDTEPFVVETEKDLIKEFCYAWNAGEPLYVEHKKEIYTWADTDDEEVLAELHADYLKLKEMLDC